MHVPLCLRKCRYCDFYSVPVEGSAASAYVEAAGKELALRGAVLRAPLASAFLGGGTPTVLGPGPLAGLLSAVAPLAGPQTEFTVEANPGTVTPSIADVLVRSGVNRMSLGAQSFEAGELRTLGRAHTAEDVTAAVRTLRAAGIRNLGLDLIYGIPGQTLPSWTASLKAALDLGLEHLSCYALSVEEGTPLWRDVRAGLTAPMDDSLQKECYRAAIEAAAREGLEHYEISNFARPGRRCRHNLTYWHNEPYLGIGPAAASYVGGVRRTNRPDLEAYLRAVGAGEDPPHEEERLGKRMTMAETMMLGLRLIEGVARAGFAARFGPDATEAFPVSLNRHRELGSLLVSGTHIRVAPDALFVCDEVLADIIAEGAR